MFLASATRVPRASVSIRAEAVPAVEAETAGAFVPGGAVVPFPHVVRRIVLWVRTMLTWPRSSGTKPYATCEPSSASMASASRRHVVHIVPHGESGFLGDMIGKWPAAGDYSNRVQYR